jgi:hypothetical protein
MILLSYGFTFAVALAVIILLVAAVTAIWEKLCATAGNRRSSKENGEALPLGPLTALAQGPKPESASSQTRGGGGLGAMIPPCSKQLSRA